MTSDFCLSDNILSPNGDNFFGDYIDKEDVKEFIKKVKEEIQRLQNKYDVVPMNYVFDEIDRLAGEKLI